MKLIKPPDISSVKLFRPRNWNSLASFKMFLFGLGSASPRGCFVNLHCLFEVFSNKRLSTISSFPIQLLFSASSNLILDDHDEYAVKFLSNEGALVVITVQGVSSPLHPTLLHPTQLHSIPISNILLSSSPATTSLCHRANSLSKKNFLEQYNFSGCFFCTCSGVFFSLGTF